MSEVIKRRYDLKPSKPSLEFPMFDNEKFGATLLPPLIDLSRLCSPIQDQGQAGSCTAHAMSGMLEFIELKDFRAKLTMQPEEFAGKGLQHVSRLFHYYNERVIEGNPNQDSGASIADSVRAVVQYGMCNENLWGYDIQSLLVHPPQGCYDQGLQHKVTQYMQLRLQDMRPCLASGYPFIIGIQVYSSFESPQVSATGNVPVPMWGEQLMGGHAICVVGYDDSKQHFICRNSWGSSWGQNGYFTLPYNYMLNPNLASDFWTVRK